jgi:hypothetical protein
MTMLTRPLAIPPLYCPFPGGNHPDAAAIEARSSDWLLAFGTHPDEAAADYLRRMRMGDLATRAMPAAPAERVQVLADFVVWTVFDDPQVDVPALTGDPTVTVALFNKILRMLETPRAPILRGNPWGEALRDIRLRLGSDASPLQIVRWIDAVRMYGVGALWHTACLRAGVMPSLDDYIMVRLPSGGLQMYTTISDWVEGYEISPEDLARPDVRALSEMAWTLISWDNDFISHYKESLAPGICINLVNVIGHEHHISLEEALREAIALRDRVMLRFVDMFGRVRPSVGPLLGRYLDSLPRWIRANIDSSVRSERYLNPLNCDPNGGLRADLPTDVTDMPSDRNPEPLLFPAIAWWWDDAECSRCPDPHTLKPR